MWVIQTYNYWAQLLNSIKHYVTSSMDSAREEAAKHNKLQPLMTLLSVSIGRVNVIYCNYWISVKLLIKFHTLFYSISWLVTESKVHFFVAELFPERKIWICCFRKLEKPLYSSSFIRAPKYGACTFVISDLPTCVQNYMSMMFCCILLNTLLPIIICCNATWIYKFNGHIPG